MIYNNYKNKNDLPYDFNWEQYVLLNDDLKNFKTKIEAETHYKNHGIFENREYKFLEIPDDFNWETYLLLNEDLKHFKTKIEAEKHYLNYGILENREYKNLEIPDDFNWETYLLLNEDLKHFKTKIEAEEHYLNNGILENRKYKLTNGNVDLNKIFPFNKYYEKKIKCSEKCKRCINKTYITMSESDLLITRKFFSDKNHEHLHYKINNNELLDILDEFILVIDFPNGGGGTTFFLNTIISKYKYYQTFVIARNINDKLHLNINEEYDFLQKYTNNESLVFLDNYKSKISKIFVNHTYGHDIEFIKKLNTLDVEIVSITHDYSNICSVSQPYFHEINKKIKNPFFRIDTLITQNKTNAIVFSKYYNKSLVLCEMPDYKQKDKLIEFDNGDKIVVGIIGNIIDIKGRKILESLIDYYKDTNIEFIVIGYTIIENFKNFYFYNSIIEFNNILMEKKPNLLLELSLWPETYSYTLTLSMITDLPIIYLNKKFNSVVHNRLKKYTKSYNFSNIEELDLLIKNHSQKYLYTISPVIYYNTGWNNIFLTKTEINKNIAMNVEFKHNIKPYFIYFPQFHAFKENNISFYEGFSDIQNLILYNNSTELKLETPLLKYLNLNNTGDYDLTNANIIQKQIDLISHYGFSGFALYYYWFSTNTVSNQNMVMSKVIDNFFSQEIKLNNRKVFFIWANENWTDNKAFGLSERYKIENNYTDLDFLRNCKNLMKYFKHDNYLKINNKPVIFVYHNYLIKNIDVFYEMLNLLCTKNNFNGVHLVLNTFVETNNKYKSFYVNFNYKKYESRFWDDNNKQIKLDYKMYIDNDYHNKKCIQTIATDFNNKPRLFEPNRLEFSTICVNNSEINKIIFINKILNNYKNNNSDTELDKILLINSFNEWGEKMTFEPSNEYMFTNINLLYNILKN